MNIVRAILLLIVLTSTAATQANDSRELHILGWLEEVSLDGGSLKLEAKLDTGADTTSLHATETETFERDGAQWVRFQAGDGDGNVQEFEKPVARTVRIRSATGRSERYVVKMDLCLGGIRATTEVNLADRDGLSNPMLVGRSFMADTILVDSGREHLASTDNCD